MSFKVSIYDPCAVLQTEDLPLHCTSKDVVRDFMPKWMVDLPDRFLIHPDMNLTLHMGEPLDNFGNRIRVTVDLKKAWNFVNYDFQNNSIHIDGYAINLRTVIPTYTLEVATLYQDVYTVERFYSKVLHLDVLPIFVPTVSPWRPVLFLGDPGNEFEFIPVDRLDEPSASPLESFPIAKSQDGQIRLGWTHPVKLIRDFENLPQHRIAVEQLEATDDSVTLINRETRTAHKCLLKRAVEVGHFPDGDEYSYTILNDASIPVFETNQMIVKANFDNADEIDYGDLVQVSFWKPSLIRRVDGGPTVALGSTVFVPISLQVSDETISRVEALLAVLLIIAGVVILANIVVALCGGSATPLWIFLNATQLIAYAVLIETPQAPDAS